MPLDKLLFELHNIKISDFPSDKSKLKDSMEEETLGSQLEDLGFKNQPLKQKILLRKARLNCFYGRPQSESLDCQNKNLANEEKVKSSWVRGKPLSSDTFDMKALMTKSEKGEKLKNLKRFKSEEMINESTVPMDLASKNAFDFKGLQIECEKLEDGFLYEGYEAQMQNLDEENVDELACYLENMANIPKELSAMAEMIYS
ncbi:uncharacterized protein LOC108096743 [Drosophila ficusphila]|uniref:uncharacterized protein LOC108096743 n=1 Tax=Drosophila ficusphila TaxID=30025 RepID=UPI0007E6C63A|nr:uncharacterized protein LOC108096743 [Drosophila ficusphila]